MKTNWQDIVLCGLFISAILAGSFGIAWVIHPFTVAWFKAYHVLVDAAAMVLAYGLLSSLVVRVSLRIKPMPTRKTTYRMDDPILTYWKFLTILYRLGQAALSWCVPVFARPVLDALFGARIGKEAAFGGTIDDPYMVSLGDRVILGHGSLVTGNYIDNGQLVCGTVTIGNGVTIGANALILPNTVIGDGATVVSGAVVGPDAVIKPGEVWRGNPARPWLAARAPAVAAASSPDA